MDSKKRTSAFFSATQDVQKEEREREEVPFSPPAPIVASPPPSGRYQKRRGETMVEKRDRAACQATVYIYSEDLSKVDESHHELAVLVARERRKQGVTQKDLQKHETWRAIIETAFAHMDEVQQNILDQRNL